MFIHPRTILLGLLSLFAVANLHADPSDQPNILFILCDDLGYGDVGEFYQNSRPPSSPSIKTPYIDQLAKSGIQLRAHYVGAPVCAPSRATLFLGQSQGNSPVRDNQFDKAIPDQPTLASTLKQANYHTGLIGKWGLQGDAQTNAGAAGTLKSKGSPQSWPSYPTKRGFDYYLGAVKHKDGHEHYPYDRVHLKQHPGPVPIWEQDKDLGEDLKGCYSTDLYTAASKKFLVSHSKENTKQPFFLVLSYDTPHAATQIATMPYPAGFGINGGIQWTGKPGAMINTASDKIDRYIHPDYADKDWKDVSKRYASSIRRIDNSVADLVQTLKDLNLHDHTLIVFSSDHGPSKESYIEEQLDPSFFQSFGPFTGIKRDCWEGGIRPGAIATWPGKIKPGSISEFPSQMQDWLPTFCDLAGTSVPAIADGTSLVPVLTGAPNPKQSTVYVEYLHQRSTPKYKQYPKDRAGQKRGQMQAVRIGDLKAIRYNVKAKGDPFLVFDLSKDPAEKYNLAGKPGIPEQQFWLDTVSRLHHTNKSAKRPYDDMPIAGVKLTSAGSGAQFTPAKERASKNYLSRDSAQISGHLNINQAGNYTFSFASGVKGILRIHELHTLDTATREPYPNSNTLNLKAGYHPFTLYLEKEAKVSDVLLWKSKQMQEATAISDDHLSP